MASFPITTFWVKATNLKATNLKNNLPGIAVTIVALNSACGPDRIAWCGGLLSLGGASLWGGTLWDTVAAVQGVVGAGTTIPK